MPRNIIRKLLPHPRAITGQRSLRFLGDRLHDPNLWHLTRQSVAGAIGVGVFVAFLPIPLQMAVAAAAAMFARVNVLIAALCVWVTNPVTIPPMFYFAYRVGTAITGVRPQLLQEGLTPVGLLRTVEDIWMPLLVGCLVTGLLAGLLGYGLTRLLWRLVVMRRWHRRQLKSPPPQPPPE
jgi:uncharacterized protein (DUF2062 family)